LFAAPHDRQRGPPVRGCVPNSEASGPPRAAGTIVGASEMSTGSSPGRAREAPKPLVACSGPEAAFPSRAPQRTQNMELLSLSAPQTSQATPTTAPNTEVRPASSSGSGAEPCGPPPVTTVAAGSGSGDLAGSGAAAARGSSNREPQRTQNTVSSSFCAPQRGQRLGGFSTTGVASTIQEPSSPPSAAAASGVVSTGGTWAATAAGSVAGGAASAGLSSGRRRIAVAALSSASLPSSPTK
jgi:hypothetical protein